MDVADIKIYCNKKYKLKKDKIIQASVFFINDVFQKHRRLLKDMKISIGLLSSEEYNKENSCGQCFVLDKIICCEVNLDEVKSQSKNGGLFKNFTKSTFFVLLHELGHAFQSLETYKNKKTSFEEHHVKIAKKIINIYENNNHLSRPEASRLILEEIKSDQFAFRNISYFENLYRSDKCLV